MRTTDALDREILEDARKKADRILRAADQTVRSTEEEWKKKTEGAIAELERTYADRRRRRIKEIMARLPLDKRRARAERADRLLRENMAAFLASLPRERALALVAGELRERLPALSGAGPFVVGGSGLTPEEAEELLAVLPSVVGRRLAEDFGAGPTDAAPELILDCGTVRVIASARDAAAELLADKRAELARALLGEGALND